MTFTINGYNAIKEDESQKKWKVAPDGRYVLYVFSVQEGFTKTQKKCVIVDFKIAEGEYKGLFIKYWVTFHKPDEPGAGLTKHFLKCIGENTDEEQMIINPNTWINKRIEADLIPNEYPTKDGEIRKSNKIKSVYSYNKMPTEIEPEEAFNTIDEEEDFMF